MDSKLAAGNGGSQHPPIDLELGQQLHGFEVKNITPIEELRAVTIELAHNHSGARLLHLYTDDTENLFSINFPTPPTDDTGVPHILEHAVLAGSQKFPVKEPFFEMIKMSMATFINAMTSSDHTYYPVASNVKKDLFNLAEVYFDAVFHPLLTEETFKREGHHLAPADPEEPTGDLKITGIVYNEMKGVFSDPESRLYRSMTSRLLPDTLYAKESGGDPDAIPDLTYQQLKGFHETYYHPSNGYFFLYGDIPTSDYLAFLADRLDKIPKNETVASMQPLNAEVTHQPRWESPQTVTDTYPVAPDESLTEKTYLMLSWLIGDATDPEDVAMCYILTLILLGNEAAPLKKAIIDSKLGTDLIFSGVSSIGPNGTFCVGIKGSEADRVEAFTNLVTDTLTELAENEFESELVEAAFQQSTYHYQEVAPMFPLRMLYRVIGAWIYDKDTDTFLKMRESLTTVRRRWQENPSIFNEMMRERLVDNPHLLTSVLSPDQNMQAELDAELEQRTKAIRAQLTEEQTRQIAADAAELERMNGQPNPPEALAKLPQLQVSDLPNRPKHIPTTVEKVCGQDLLHSDVFANGVNYFVLDFDIRGLPQHLWTYLPRYIDAIHKLGAAEMDFAEMALRKSSVTGGIRCGVGFRTHALDPSRSLQNAYFHLKVLDGKMDVALDVLHDLVFSVNPRDAERLHDVMVQAVAEYQTEMVQDGSSTATHHASRGLSPQAHLAEIVYGLPQLRHSENLLNNFDEHNADLIGHIEEIRYFLLNRGRVTAGFVGSDSAYQVTRTKLGEWLRAMGDESVATGPVAFQPYDTPPREGLAGPIQIAHCAHVMPAPHYSHPDSALISIGTHLVGMDYILSEIRFKGNAYGARLSYNSFDAALYQSSFRDPHVARTINVFEQTVDYIKQVEWTQTDIDRAIIATAKDAEKPIRPSQAVSNAQWYHISGQTRELREERYAQRLSATPSEVQRALLQVFEENLDKAAVCVVSSREKLEAANNELEQPLAIEDILT
ncbi:insulinase family protein [Candidatus Poribacteria bacterium]|nr:insulinase family protein [Candidatus Poribacteria bacterium]